MDDLIERTWTQMNSLQPSKGSDAQDPARPLKRHISERVVEAINSTQMLAKNISKLSSYEVWHPCTLFYDALHIFSSQHCNTAPKCSSETTIDSFLVFAFLRAFAASRWLQSWSEHESGHHQVDKGGEAFWLKRQEKVGCTFFLTLAIVFK